MALADIINNLSAGNNGGDTGAAPSGFNWGALGLPTQQYQQPAYTPQQDTDMPSWYNGGGYQPDIANNGFDWQNFVNQYNQVQQANQQQQQQSMFSQSQDQNRQDNRGYRKMNDVDRFLGGLNQATEWLSNAASEATGLGKFNPEEGFTAPNIARFVVNLPGQLVSSITDLPVHIAEAATGTPFTEADMENDTIPEYQMDTNQRLASAGYAGLDVLGFIPGLGPEARAAGLAAKGIGAGAKAAGKVAGREGLEAFGAAAARGGTAASRGFVKEGGALESAAIGAGFGKAGVNAARVGDSAIDIAASSAFEGAQEAGQTLLEDVRYNQFDDKSWERAAQGAAWGALGGGIVSGASNIANGLKTQATDPTREPQQNTSPQFEREKDRNKTTMSGAMVDSARKRLAELSRENNEIPGSTSALSTVIDRSKTLTQAGLGENAIHAMLQANDNGESVKAIASRFNSTPEEIMRIDSIESPAERVEMYNALIDRNRENGTPVTIVLGRNPDTALGTALFNLDSVFLGDGIHMNRQAYMMFGGDVDGDKTQVHFGNGAQHNGYLTNNLVSSATGVSRLNEDYMQFGDSEETLERFDQMVDEMFSPYPTAKTGYFKQKYRESFKDGKADVNSLSQLFTDMRTSLYHQERLARGGNANANSLSYDVDNRIAELMYQTESLAVNMPQKFVDVVTKLTDEEQAAADELYKTLGDAGDAYLRSGDTAGASHFAQFAADLAYKIASNTNLGNPFFRQSGQVYYHAQKDQRLWFGGLDKTQLKNVYDHLIAFSFRLTDIGGEVENSIEGIWRVTIQDEVMTRLASQGFSKADINGGWQQVIDTFIDVHDEYVGVFNRSLEQQTTRDSNAKLLDSAVKKKLSNTDDSVRNRAVARAFTEVFGEYYFNDFLDLPNTHPMYGKSINNGIEEYAVHAGRWNGMFSNYQGFNGFWKTLLEDYDGKQNAVGVRVENEIESMAQKLRQLGQHITRETDADGNESWSVDPDYMDLMAEVVDSFNLLISPDSSRHLSLATVDSFINTAWGRELLSGDESRMKNAFVSIQLTDQYQRVIDIATEHDVFNEPEYFNYMLNEASQLADNSPLHMAIYADMEKNGSYGMLLAMTDLDVAYNRKQDMFNRIMADNYGGKSLVAASLHSSDTEMSISAVSNRLKQVTRTMNRAVRKSKEYNLQILKNIDDAISDGVYSIDDAVAAMREFSNQEYVEFSSDVVASFAYSQYDIIKEMVDKGTTTRSSDMLYQQAAHIWQGGNLSYIDQLGIELGNMSVGNWQSNRIQILRVLNDPKAEIRLWDPMQDGTVIMTQKSMFAEFGINISDSGPTADQYLAFLHEVPQLASIITPTKLDAISDGSNSIMSEGMQKRLDAAIRQWSEKGDKVTRQLSEDRNRNKVKQMMFQDPDWWGMLIASTEGLGGNMTLEETKRAVDAAVNRHVDFFMEYARMGEGEAFDLAKQAYFNDMFTETMDQAVALMNDVEMVKKYMEITGSIASNIANDAACSSIAMAKLSAVQRVFEMNNVKFDASDAISSGFNADEVNGIMSLLEKHGQTYVDLSFALMNMADSSDISFESYIRAGRLDDEIQRQIEQLRDEGRIDEADKIEAEISSWNNGFSGFLKYITGSDSAIEATDFVSDLVITDAAIPSSGNPGWTADEWVSRCREIMDTCGKLDEFETDIVKNDGTREKVSKAEKDIRDSLEDGDYQKIKSYYNNVIVEKLTGDLTFGTGRTVNLDAMKQTLDAKRRMIDIADRIRDDLRSNGRIEERAGSKIKLPDINFHYDNTTIAYMATSGVMNAQGGSVGSGIGVDGAMTKLISAFGALPADSDCGTRGELVSVTDLTEDNIGWNYTDIDGNLKRIRDVNDLLQLKRQATPEVWVYDPAKCLSWSCSKCSPASRSSSNSKINMVSSALSELASWMQEARHLKAKKTVGFAGLISEGIDPRSDLMEPIQFKVGNSNDLIDAKRLGLLDALFTRRGEIATFWNNKFDEAGSSLPLDMEHAIAITNATTPIMEVVDSNGAVTYVSVHDLAHSEDFVAKYPMLAEADIITCRPVVMSLQEVSSKIIRDICKKYYGSNSRGSFSKQDINDAAKAAVEDWSSYNTTKMDMHNILNGIIAHGPAYNTGMTADAMPSAKLRWNESNFETMSRLFRGKKFEARPATERASRVIEQANIDLHNQDILPDSYVVMNYSTDGSYIYGKLDTALRNLSFSESGEDGNSNIEYFNNRKYVAVEMFNCDIVNINADTIKSAEKARERSSDNGRPFIVPTAVFDKMSGISNAERYQVTHFNMEGVDYVYIDPNINDLIAYYRGTSMQMAVEEMSPDEITVAIGVGDRLDLPDGAHYTRRDYQPLYSYHGDNAIRASQLLRGYNPIEMVTDYNEIASIKEDDIDYRYYEELQGRPDMRVYRSAVDNFIKSASGKQGQAYIQRNVAQDACIGFVKQQQGIKTVYAPLFYSGSVPSTASSVITRLSHGMINITFSTDKIDYNGNESMKLDLYGVAYKSVGHMVSQEMQDQYWSAIDDCGFNLVSSPEHMFDYHALSSRVFGMNDSIVQNNLFYFSRKVGVNLFFDIDKNNKPVRKPGLSRAISNNELSDLVNGSEKAWGKVASGELRLFENIDNDTDLTVEMNDIIERLTREILLDGGFPHLFFNSRQITWDPNTDTFVNEGIWPRDMTFRMSLKYLNRDKTLKLFHLLDKRLCPNGWDAGANDSMDTVFDRSGKMIDRNTISGNPERVYALVGPHYYTGQGTAIGNLSREASYSNQHMIKRMMELGVYPSQVDDLVEFLGLQTGDYGNLNDSAADRLKNYDLAQNKRVVNSDLYDKVAMSISDPIQLASIDRYRETLSSLLKETTHKLPVTLEDLKTDAFTDAIARRQIEDARVTLNQALGNPDPRVALTTDQMLELVRYETGYTENDGRGFTNGLTYNQVINSVERMKQNLSEGGLIITGGRYQGANGDTRIHIPLFPKGLSARLMAMPRINSYYKGDLEKFIDDQMAELETVTMPAIEAIENEKKRRALYRFADAVCYANGKDMVSGHVFDNVYMPDVIKSIRDFGGKIEGYDPEFLNRYEELSRLNNNYINKLKKLSTSRESSIINNKDGGRTVVFHGDRRSIATKILRNLSSLRKTIGMSYAFMLPANVAERYVNQGMQSIALQLGQAKIGPYASTSKVDPEVARNAVKDESFRKLYIALRSAELVGSDGDLLVAIRNGADLDAAIEQVLRSKGAFERFQEKFTNVMSGNNVGIEGQMRNFIDRFAQRTANDAPWWNMKAQGSNRTILEQQLEENPSRWFIDVLNGSSQNPGADGILARQCLNWAKRGDMAQKNLVSAIYSEIASRHAGFEFFTTAFVSPYFQYATNRMGRILNMVAPISSIHYVVTDFLTNGAGKNLPLGKDLKFGDLALEDVQFQANLKEAITIDILHLGPAMVGLMLIGMAGAIEPPDDEDKWGNFKEWTIFGQRVDVAWWLEDILGLALPIAVFGKSAQLGKPRLDLIVNGIAYYLANNPVTKVADAISVLLDPMSELQQDYDKDVEGYAKAMGGPPQMTDIVNGKATSFGLSFVSQFITPGFIREIYNGSQQFEPTYKRVFETDATGRLTQDAKNDNKTQYTTYQDAIVRKFTKNNPVMGLLADLVLQPTTGYMSHEMPDRIVYDPEQMNSIEAFSLYEDPWTKKQLKSEQEQLGVCLAAVATLQSKSVEELHREGFMLDYDTKVFVGKWLWDNIASLNEQWNELEQSGALNYYTAGNGDYNEGMRIVSELKQQHYAMINDIKSLYYDKLWSDELKSPAQYNQLHTTWAQDDNGEWYATGYYPSWFMPVTLAPTETEGGYQYVMSRENDWATESIVTGGSTGQRGLIPREIGKVTTPDIQSWSSDGTATGHSDLYNASINGGNASGGSGSGSGTGFTSTSGYPSSSSRRTSSGTSYPRSSGGGYRSGGGGGRSYTPSSGSSSRRYTPNISAPNASAPVTTASLPRVTMSKANPSRIMGNDRLVTPDEVYLRPDFETKGSREAYKRSDI